MSIFDNFKKVVKKTKQLVNDNVVTPAKKWWNVQLLYTYVGKFEKYTKHLDSNLLFTEKISGIPSEYTGYINQLQEYLDNNPLNSRFYCA